MIGRFNRSRLLWIVSRFPLICWIRDGVATVAVCPLVLASVAASGIVPHNGSAVTVVPVVEIWRSSATTFPPSDTRMFSPPAGSLAVHAPVMSNVTSCWL